MYKTRIVVSGFFLYLCASFHAGQNPPAEPEDAARIARIENGLLPGIAIKGKALPRMKLADRMRYYNVPGVSIAFFDHGRITWIRTYGFADIRQHRPATPETLFQAGSISKPTTALAALRLVQEGKLQLDEDVNARLSEWKVPTNEFTKDQKVTLRRLLSHSGGVNVHGFVGYIPHRPLPTVFQILDGEKPANTEAVRVIAVPGTAWRYSGGGYTIVQLLLTETVRAPFPQILDDLVLKPAGMTHSTFEQPLPSNREPRAATPYRSDGEPVEGGFRTYPEMAAAGLWTTPSDLAQMMIEVQKEYAGQSSTILSPEMAGQMLARQKDDWGLGFAIEEPGHSKRFGHGGSDEGFESRVEAYTRTGQGIAIMTNGARGDELIREILCAVAEEYQWPDFRPHEHALAKLDPARLSAMTGTYQFSDGTKLKVVMRDGSIYLEGISPQPQELLPETEKKFFMLTDNIVFQFDGDEKHAVRTLTMYDGGDVLEARKVSKP